MSDSELPPTQEISNKDKKRQKKHERWLEKRAKMKEERKEKKKNYKRPKSLYTENREEWDARREAGTTIIIDCDWTPMMTDKEYNSFLHQLGYVYASNKKSENP